jgi:hypothetical protein
MQDMNEADVARAIAYFATCDDLELLRDVLRRVRPKAANEVARFERERREVPAPAELAPAESAASREEALRTLNVTRDFALLQALSRAAGRRVEALMEERGR